MSSSDHRLYVGIALVAGAAALASDSRPQTATAAVGPDTMSVSVDAIAPDVVPIPVVDADRPLVTPVQYQPLRRYQESVNIDSASAGADSLIGSFVVPPNFTLVVEQLYVNVNIPNNKRFFVRLTGWHDGDLLEHDLDLEIAPDVDSQYQTFALQAPTRLFLDDHGDSQLGDFFFVLSRPSDEAYFWRLRVTVVGHLVPATPDRGDTPR